MCTGECLIGLPIAFLPSIIWLMFFVFQDKHREKVRNLIEIFIWGVLIAIPVAFVERIAGFTFYDYYLASAILFTTFSFVGIAFVEEFGKYIVVRFKAMGKDFFDEPQDAIIYMAASALGFAAIENVVYVLDSAQNFGNLLGLVALRGITSNFLHVAASATLGYFLALSIENKKEGKKFLFTGLALATLLHGIFNGFIMDIIEQGEGTGSVLNVFLLSSLLIVSGIVVVVGLNRLANDRFSPEEDNTKYGK